jgi:DNA-binding response OmpR family regulator
MTSETSQQTSATVLVVDDEGANRYSVCKTLRRVGYEVHEAASGEEALQQLERMQFDVVLTDIRMNPGMDGVELLRQIKQQSPDTIVILMTGFASLPSAVQAIRLDAHDYLIKPSSSQDIRQSVARGVERAQNLRRRRQLLDTIKNDVYELTRSVSAPVPHNTAEDDDDEEDDSETFVPRTRAAHSSPVGASEALPATMRLGPLTVFTGRYQVSLGEQPIDLTPTEFDLLLYLAAHRGRVVPCHELVREVRNYNVDEVEAREVIRPHISNLRRKLKKASPSADVVTNVRGIGYRIDDRLSH